ncbi:MAG: hypothetical protein LBD36_02950, partial [Holosporales bacterium]|nr:hypothetical protein [Holosporales bacterium]
MGQEKAAEIKTATSELEIWRQTLLDKVNTAIAENANISQDDDETKRINTASIIAELTVEINKFMQSYAIQYDTMIQQINEETVLPDFTNKGLASSIAVFMQSFARGMNNSDPHKQKTYTSAVKHITALGSTPYEFVFLKDEEVLPERLQGHIQEIKHLFAYKSFSTQILDYAQMPQLSSVYLFGRALEQDERNAVRDMVRTCALSKLHIPLWGSSEIAANLFESIYRLSSIRGFEDVTNIGN